MSLLDDALERYRGRRVLITGDTGFKGSWLSAWLARAEAEVHGYALPPPTVPSLFSVLGLEERIRHHEGDVRDRDGFERVWKEASPEIVFHLAAQPVVAQGYRDPLETIETNVLGVGHALELARRSGSSLALVINSVPRALQYSLHCLKLDLFQFGIDTVNAKFRVHEARQIAER